VVSKPCALGTSRGYETASSRLLMRWSTVASDLVFLLPGLVAFVYAFYGPRGQKVVKTRTRTTTKTKTTTTETTTKAKTTVAGGEGGAGGGEGEGEPRHSSSLSEEEDGSSSSSGESATRMAWAVALLALSPAPILIDHGHFQYNGISLGCVAGAAAAVVSGWDLTGWGSAR
jgi:alpha-1,3-glucosyltransferase